MNFTWLILVHFALIMAPAFVAPFVFLRDRNKRRARAERALRLVAEREHHRRAA